MDSDGSDPDTEREISREKLLAILTICRHLNSERDLGQLLIELAAEASRLLDADRASIFLLDPERSELWSKVATGTDQVIRFDARLGIAGDVAMTGKTVNVPDAYADPRFNPAIDRQTGYQTRSILAVPLTDHAGQVVGTFQVINKATGPFDGMDVQVLQALAGNTAIVTETMVLIQRLKAQRDELLVENTRLRRVVEERSATGSILGTSRAIREIVRQIDAIRDSALSALIVGESGTGKELIAKAIHDTSPRAAKPFVAINCAAIPDTLIESELFGIEKGTASGVDARIGRFEQAHEGTLFLDEIGDLSLSAQAKILRVLQEVTVERVGGRRTLPVDVRIVAATNKDLEREVAERNFRQDLYYRLNVIRIATPPLREIRSDIPLLANHLLARHSAAAGSPPKEIRADTLECLTAHAWPGNVRELDNEMKRVAVMVRGSVVRPEHLSVAVRAAGTASPSTSAGSLKSEVESLERRLILEALEAGGNNKCLAARRLGLSRQGLQKKLTRYDLDPTAG